MQGENLGSNFSMRTQMRAASDWIKKKKNDCDGLFSQAGETVRVSEQKVLMGVYSCQIEQLTNKTALKWS